MMLVGTITIPAGSWIWAAGVLLTTALVLLVRSYKRAPAGGTSLRIAFGLKLLGLLVLALCLLEPLWSGRRAKSGANILVAVADNSSGMNIHDRGSTQSRGDILRDIVEADRSAADPAPAGWLARLAESFQLRRYLVDSRLRRTADFAELTFDGKATSLGMALRTLAERYKGRPLAGVVLMTDGCATDIGDELPDLSGLPPVYPVVIGRGGPQRDISVTNVAVSQTSFEDAPVTIQSEVEAAGFAGRTIAVDLLEDAGRLVERQHWNVGRDDQKQVFRFRVRPAETGVLFYRLRAGDTAPDESSDESEATPVNNQRTVVVDRGKGPYRVLYVSGRPNWEFRFLRRAVEDDEQVQLVALVRVAKREPKYDWRGHAGETSNPLYRGFDAPDQEEAEQYDQPVLVRLNTRDKQELSNGFPRTREELFDYHAVILDDVEAAFFTRDQMDLLRRFVAERGGGLLMLGGTESFQRGDFQNTPIGSILPVYLDPQSSAPASSAVRLHLTREGWLEPWARLRDNEKDEQRRLTEMPEFRVLNRTGRAKPGARIIEAAGDEMQPIPALVVQRLGNGRTAALAVGDIWRWGLRNPQMHDDMDKFWRQTLRWLVTDVPDRMSLQVNHKQEEANQPVVVRVRVRDKAFEPLDGAAVTIEVREPGGESVQLTAAPVPSESGLFEAAYVPRTSGGYVARAVATDAAGAAVGEAEAGWATDLEAREFQSVKTNRPLLEEIARRTGGRIVEIDGLDEFARSLPRRDVPITEVWTRPLWDLPGVLPAIFLLVLACFIAEWALRRWKGMP
jgi:uncharacterized membrane protein